jgi:hypothetical protein
MKPLITPAPPLGWNSWDCYGASVTEAEVLGNAEYLAAHLKPFGWNTVVVDIQWSEPTANSSQYHAYAPLTMDRWSRLIPTENRFPSAKDGRGFASLAARVHALGLQFGIHIMRGIPRQAVHQNTPIENSRWTARDIAHPNSICPWNTDMYGVDPKHPGAQDYYDSLFRLYASWGVDYVKIDDLAASRLYAPHIDELALVRRALDRCGRPMVLSLSPGPASVELAHAYREYADMWRITDDFWDRWDLLKDMFDRCERWYEYVGPGSWPDCDMLPLGHIGLRSVDGGGADRMTRFTRDEQRTMMSLWALFRSPLMLGGELRDNDEWTLSLLTNREMLDVNQKGSRPRPVTVAGEHRVWRSDAPDGAVWVGLFNLSERVAEVSAPFAQLGLSEAQSVHDVWSGAELGVFADTWATTLPPHGSALVRLTSQR